jgi:dihydrofolate synthase/folylpolyglutamate synthase
MQFAEALRYLLSLGHETLAIKLGLKNIQLLLEQLGNPQHSYFSVQIAGTNGKGSTAAMLDSICRAAEINTGLFTSPHLSSLTERVQINGDEISQTEFAALATKVRAAAEALLASDSIVGTPLRGRPRSGIIQALPTFFEQVTAIALLAFQKSNVELAILETGLGGRLDATTAVEAKVVGITPIARDHEMYLGETITSISAEKAAIIRPGVTAIVAPQEEEALRVIRTRGETVGVVPSVDECQIKVEGMDDGGRARVTFQTKTDRYENVFLGLRGRHQITNASVAVRLAESLRTHGFDIPPAAIIAGLETANHPGRLERFEGRPSVLLDGAHNPAGAQALRDYLEEFVTSPLTLVFGAMRDKRLDAMAEVLFPLKA